MYTLIIASNAQNQIKKISKDHQKAIIFALRELKEDPFLGKKLYRELTGRNALRVGVYRVIYIVNKIDKKVTVVSAGHRATVI